MISPENIVFGLGILGGIGIYIYWTFFDKTPVRYLEDDDDTSS